jgi:hypothetical protein
MFVCRVLLLLMTIGSQVYAADATGFVRAERCGSIAANNWALYLEHIHHHKIGKPIAMEFPDSAAWSYFLDSKEWVDVSGHDCLTCNPVKSGRVRITRVSKGIFIPFRGRFVNGASGDFEVELRDGTKEQGSFKAKIRSRKELLICE